jgi:hypothetical protein
VLVEKIKEKFLDKIYELTPDFMRENFKVSLSFMALRGISLHYID